MWWIPSRALRLPLLTAPIGIEIVGLAYVRHGVEKLLTAPIGIEIFQNSLERIISLTF